MFSPNLDYAIYFVYVNDCYTNDQNTKDGKFNGNITALLTPSCYSHPEHKVVMIYRNKSNLKICFIKKHINTDNIYYVITRNEIRIGL